MTREMQDGINSDAAGMDHNIALVAYYIDGIFAWTAAEVAMFPHSVHVRIAVRASTRDGHVIDCESGDATPAQAAAWAHQRRLDGYAYPTVYTSVSNQGAVIAAFNAIGEPMPLWWLAHYDNLDVLPAGVIAKQYADPGPFDRSIVADYWPGVDGGTPMTGPVQLDLNQQVTAYTGNGPAKQTSESVGNLLGLIEACYEVLSGQQGWAASQLVNLNTAVATLTAQVTALSGTLSADEAALLAAVKAQTAGSVDVNAFAAALAPVLVPLLPANATSAQIGAAVEAAIAAQFSK